MHHTLIDFHIVLLYCINMQPGTRISFGINKVLSYLILYILGRILKQRFLHALSCNPPTNPRLYDRIPVAGCVVYD